MKIDRIELREIHLPLVAPFETSFGVTTGRRIILVKVFAEGLYGWGECTCGEGHSITTKVQIRPGLCSRSLPDR
jgi:L-alanine-DL-glutamate epimerase-like enolase superfamily enzyme